MLDQQQRAACQATVIWSSPMTRLEIMCTRMEQGGYHLDGEGTKGRVYVMDNACCESRCYECTSWPRLLGLPASGQASNGSRARRCKRRESGLWAQW